MVRIQVRFKLLTNSYETGSGHTFGSGYDFVSIFIVSFILFDGQIITSPELRGEIMVLLLITPLIHRGFNIMGFKLGLKSVPY